MNDLPQKGDGGISRDSSNSSQVRDSLISGVVTGSRRRAKESESTGSRPRRLMILRPLGTHSYTERHLENDWCARARCIPVTCAAHNKIPKFVSRDDGWSYFECPEGCWLDIHEPGDKRPASPHKK